MSSTKDVKVYVLTSYNGGSPDFGQNPFPGGSRASATRNRVRGHDAELTVSGKVRPPPHGSRLLGSTLKALAQWLYFEPAWLPSLLTLGLSLSSLFFLFFFLEGERRG